MLRVAKRLSAVAFVASCSALVGCADDEATLFVRQVVAPNDSCEFANDPEQPHFVRGLLDTYFAAEYSAHVLVGNQMVAQGSPERLRDETSKVALYEYETRVLDADGAEVAGFKAPCSGLVDQKDGDTEAYGLTNVVLIDSVSSAALADASAASGTQQEVVASLIVRGRTLGGNEIETGEFLFPISVCRGCSIYFPPSADDAATPGLCDKGDADDPDPVCTPGVNTGINCLLCRKSATPSAGDPCNPG